MRREGVGRVVGKERDAVGGRRMVGRHRDGRLRLLALRKENVHGVSAELPAVKL